MLELCARHSNDECVLVSKPEKGVYRPVRLSFAKASYHLFKLLHGTFWPLLKCKFTLGHSYHQAT